MKLRKASCNWGLFWIATIRFQILKQQKWYDRTEKFVEAYQKTNIPDERRLLPVHPPHSVHQSCFPLHQHTWPHPHIPSCHFHYLPPLTWKLRVLPEPPNGECEWSSKVAGESSRVEPFLFKRARLEPRVHPDRLESSLSQGSTRSDSTRSDSDSTREPVEPGAHQGLRLYLQTAVTVIYTEGISTVSQLDNNIDALILSGPRRFRRSETIWPPSENSRSQSTLVAAMPR